MAVWWNMVFVVFSLFLNLICSGSFTLLRGTALLLVSRSLSQLGAPEAEARGPDWLCQLSVERELTSLCT